MQTPRTIHESVKTPTIQYFRALDKSQIFSRKEPILELPHRGSPKTHTLHTTTNTSFFFVTATLPTHKLTYYHAYTDLSAFIFETFLMTHILLIHF